MIPSPTNRVMLVTGSSGFIGANVVRAALADGWSVVAACRAADIPWRLADIDDDRLTVQHNWDLNSVDHVYDLLNLVRPGVVVNAAAQGSHLSERSVPGMFSTNVSATATLAEACCSSNTTQLILLGSVLEYQPSESALSEGSLLAPETLYGLTKSLSAQIGAHYNTNSALSVTELRLFNIFGPWDDPRKLIPYVITQAICGEDIHLSTGEQQRDFVFIDDVTRIIMGLADKEVPAGRPFNVCSGSPVAVAEVARRILDLCLSTSTLTFGSVTERGDNRSIVTGSTKLRSFGFAPCTRLEDGLRSTIEWYRNSVFIKGEAA